MEQLDKQGRLIFPKEKSGRIREKKYLKDMPGVKITNLWLDIPAIQSQAAERLGYPTQKPEALVKRVLDFASNAGDLVLDCFAGGGTTAKACLDMDRRFIAGDVSPVAVKIMAQRLNVQCPNGEYTIKNLPQTVEEFQGFDGHEFAEMVCDLMGWKVNERKSGDGGVDGWSGDGDPVQIKNHSNTGAGRPEIQKFHSAIIKQKRKKGIFVAWQFARTALEYIAQIKSEHGIEIIAKPCSEVFGDLVIPHEKAENIRRLYAERLPDAWKDRGDARLTESPSEINASAVDMLLEKKHKATLEKIAKAKAKGKSKAKAAKPKGRKKPS